MLLSYYHAKKPRLVERALWVWAVGPMLSMLLVSALVMLLGDQGASDWVFYSTAATCFCLVMGSMLYSCYLIDKAYE